MWGLRGAPDSRWIGWWSCCRLNQSVKSNFLHHLSTELRALLQLTNLLLLYVLFFSLLDPCSHGMKKKQQQGEKGPFLFSLFFFKNSWEEEEEEEYSVGRATMACLFSRLYSQPVLSDRISLPPRLHLLLLLLLLLILFFFFLTKRLNIFPREREAILNSHRRVVLCCVQRL